MKSKILILTLLITFSMNALTLIDRDRTIDVSLEELLSYPQKQVETSRDKNGKVSIEIWTGVDLKQLLDKNQITDFYQLRFTSEDNYQVRLSAAEIVEHSPIIALQRNGEKLDETQIRLIAPQIRDMYWIQGISTVTTEKKTKLPLPYSLLTAEKILENMEIQFDPVPFKKVEGYYFIDLAARAFPILQGEFLLVSSDGVSQLLDFEKYLKNAVLIRVEDRFNLQSPDMPGGMWIKDLVYVQTFDRAVFFKDRISDLKAIGNLLGWKELPELLLDQDGNQIAPETEFSDPVWQNVKKVRWQD